MQLKKLLLSLEEIILYKPWLYYAFVLLILLIRSGYQILNNPVYVLV